MEGLAGRLKQSGVHAAAMALHPAPKKLATLAWIGGFAEILSQIREQGRELDRLYVASSGNSFSGMTLAARALGVPTVVTGVSPLGTVAERLPACVALANDAARALGWTTELSEQDFDLDDRQVPPGYGRPSEASIAAMGLVARSEGLLLDPIYTGKCMAALASDIRAGKIGRNETVVFVHTGGLPTVFAFPQELSSVPA